jgi:hypothetical protein
MGNVASNWVGHIVSNVVQPSSWELDGLLVAQTAVSGVDTITLTGATDVVAQDVCFQANVTPQQVFPPPIPPSPSLSVYDTSPLPGSFQTDLPELLAAARAQCASAEPAAIGIAELRRSVADLGDGVNGHLDLFGQSSPGAQLAQDSRPRWPRRPHRERPHRPEPPAQRCVPEEF